MPTHRKGFSFLASDFGDTATGTQIAVHDLEVSSGFDGVVEGTDNVLTGRQTGMVGQVFPVGFARNGHLVPIKQIVVHHEFDHARCPTNVLHILHDVPTRGLEIRQEWNLYTNVTKTDWQIHV